MSTRLRVLCALTMLLALSAGAAQAHAYVVGAQPPMGGSDQQLAGQISISFDEPVDVLDSDAVQVFDAYGTRIDRHDAAIDREDATRVLVHVPQRLKPGVYTVRWRVVSADTHVVAGIYQIGVGVPLARKPITESQSPFDPSAPLPSLLRWLSLIGALLAGGAVFLRWDALDRLERMYPGGVEIARRCAIAGTAVLLAAALPSLIVQASAAGGALGRDIPGTLMETTWGVAFLVRVGTAAVLLFASIAAWQRLTRGAIALIAVLLATFSAAGHALSQSSRAAAAVAATVDFVHLVAAAAWVGGVFVLAAILLPALARRDASVRERTRALFAAFSPLALVCAVVVVATGTYASLTHVSSLGDLVGSAYGRVLFAKIVGVGFVLWLGWRHLRVGAGALSWGARATLRYEALAGLLVVALTAVLIGQAPPGHGSALPNSTAGTLVAMLCILAIARAALNGKPVTARYLNGSIAFVLAALLVNAFLIGPFYVRAVFMVPTLWAGDVVLVDETAYRRHTPREGDIAIFAPPVEFNGDDIAQRVIGVPGDTITINDGVVYRNGAALREPYEYQPPAYDLAIRSYGIYVDGQPLDPHVANVPQKALWQAPNRIPNGFYFMLGDNRNYSIDSHIFGFAQTGGPFAAGPLAAQKARASFEGRAFLSIWPLHGLRLPQASWRIDSRKGIS